MSASPMGLGQLWGFPMKKYSIVRIGSEYVVQAGEPGNRTPILALTANTLVEDRYACFEAGMDGFLIKPLDREKLAEALMGLIASRHIAA